MTPKTSPVEPFTPAMFYILLVLADHDSHGYGIMQEVAAQTDRSVRLGPGTLYRSIRNLVAAGMIAECGERPDPALDDERRKYYRITATGRHAAEDEAERLAQLVHVAQSRHLLPRRGRRLMEGAE